MSEYVRGRAIRSVEERNAEHTALAREVKSPCDNRPPPPHPASTRAGTSGSTMRRRLFTPPASQICATEHLCLTLRRAREVPLRGPSRRPCGTAATAPADPRQRVRALLAPRHPRGRHRRGDRARRRRKGDSLPAFPLEERPRARLPAAARRALDARMGGEGGAPERRGS